MRAVVIESKTKTFIFHLTLWGTGIVFSLFLVEGLLRLFPVILPQGVQLRIHWQEMGRQGLKSIGHPYIGFLYPANSTGGFERDDLSFSFNTDNFGFRNQQAWPKPADIVVVGDSLAFGYGVDDDQTWSELLMRTMPSLSLVNLALIGSGPQNYQRVYETFGVGLDPKLLIVGFFPDNDLRDAVKFHQWLQLGGQGNYDAYRLFGQYQFRPNRDLEGFIRGSYLHALLRDVRSAFKDQRLLAGRTVTLADEKKIQLVNSRFENQKKLMEQENLGLTLTIQAFQNLKKLTAEKSTELLILIFPSKEAVYLPVFSDLPKDILGGFKQKMEKLGIDYLDLTPFFQEWAGKGEKLFYAVDGHPNQRGYQLVADVVLAKLQDEGHKYGLRR